MSDSNKKTIETYESRVNEYVARTPQQVDSAYREWLDEICSLLPEHPNILEVGSGHGIGASYFRDKGFDIDATDATEGFINLLQGKGFKTFRLNLLTDVIPTGYDLIVALAVLLHFSPEELSMILGKIYGALKTGGVLAFSVKRGEGSEWSDHKLGAPRFFHYWQPDSIREMVIKAKFKNVEISSSHESADQKTWVQVIARKI